ncbi:hypothetical protein [Paracoccus luteus]|uniref:hypothetical protein n=1 Tax=Paracoccus luteus TaxID=2508543 RepID=UPI00106F4004|nr:hypothetical protein [Paracoccus luteus]
MRAAGVPFRGSFLAGPSNPQKIGYTQEDWKCSVPAFEADDNKGPIVLGRGEKFKAYPDGKEEFPDLLTLNVVDTPRGRMVASVHRAEVFPDKDQAADPYISAFLEKYGENPSSGWKFKYDGQREYGFNPCGEVPIILEPRGLGRTPTTGVSLTVRQTDASCAYQTDYQISDMGGVIRGYAVMSVSPFVHYESIYPQWAEKQAEELRDATRLQSSTSAPEL